MKTMILTFEINIEELGEMTQGELDLLFDANDDSTAIKEYILELLKEDLEWYRGSEDYEGNVYDESAYCPSCEKNVTAHIQRNGLGFLVPTCDNCGEETNIPEEDQ